MLNGGKTTVFLLVIALAWVLSEMSAAPIYSGLIEVISENGLQSTLGLMTIFIRGNYSMYKLCVAEKPSVAVEIGKVIGAAHRNDGYLDGKDFLVTWALGHLIEFAEPEEYGYIPQNEIWQDKENALSELPILPAQFKTRVVEGKKKQFEIIRQLMNRDDVELIIDCGDMGPEGHYLQWLIRSQVNCGKPVMRFCATSLTDEAIRNAMGKLRRIEEFGKIIEGEYCKHKADWSLGISMSRFFSLKYNGRIDVGRVMSPTLYFVVKRYLDLQNFKPQAYYQIKAGLEEGFSVFLKCLPAGVPGVSQTGIPGVSTTGIPGVSTTGIPGVSTTGIPDVSTTDIPSVSTMDVDAEGRLINQKAADLIAVTIATNPEAVIGNIETNRRAADRPQLYDITELQRDGNRIYGYSAADVLAAAQNLYERKILSYPRTDSRYLTSDLKDVLRQRILDIQTLDKYRDAAGSVLQQQTGLNIDRKIIDNDKVTDHHALIVTEMVKGCDFDKLGEIERNILHLVISRMIVAMAQKYVYGETAISVSCCYGRYILTAKGKKTIQKGYKHVIGLLMGDDGISDASEETDEEQTFPNISIGQAVHISNAVTVTKHTAAPKLHTEATLLTAMENAGTQIENGTVLKGKGIGTQATRAEIIKKLFDIGYVVNKPSKKIKYIEPTKLGINCIRVLPQELYSPKITADWETRIAAIVEGNSTPDQFMGDFERFINDMIRVSRNASVEGVSFSNRESVGVCPFCGKGEVYTAKGKSDKANMEVDVYFCSLKCGFSLYSDANGFFNHTDRTLKKTQVIHLINKETIKAKTKHKDKYGIFELLKNERGKAYIRLIDK